MESRAHALVALIFILVLGAALGLAGLWMHHAQPEGKEYSVVSPFSVAGLTDEAPVRFKGVRVGKVEHIGFDPENPRMVLVRISISPKTPVTRATFAELSPQGVTGLSYLSLSDEGKDFSPLSHRPGQLPAIPMHPSFLHVLSGNGESLVNQGNNLAIRLNSLLDNRNRQYLGRILAHLAQASQELVAIEAALKPALQTLPATLRATRSAMTASTRLMGHLDGLAVAAKAPLDSLAKTADSLNALSAASQKTLTTLNYRELPQLDRLTRNLMASSETLTALGRTLQRSPQSLLYGRRGPPPGPGEPGFHRGGGSQ